MSTDRAGMLELGDPVHFSNLKKFSISPAHYLASIGPSEDTDAFALGRLTHALVLGGKYAVYEGVRRGKEWDKWKTEREAEGLADENLYTSTQYVQALAAANAVKNDPIAAPLLVGDFEVPMEWTGPTSRRCATRGIDVLSKPHKRIVELKTAVSSAPGRFGWEAKKFGYHAQGAFYQTACRLAGIEINDVWIVAVEKKKPHAVTCFRLTPRLLIEGDKLCRAWLECLRSCEESNNFPPYTQCPVELDIDEDTSGDVVLSIDGEEVAA